MTTFTRRAIVETFVELLEERPIDKITVSELAQRCGVSRNTFYYHFGDVYEVVDELFHTEEAHLIEDSDSITTVEEGLRAATRLAAEHQSAVTHLYQSAQRDRLMGYFHRAAHISMGALVESRPPRWTCLARTRTPSPTFMPACWRAWSPTPCAPPVSGTSNRSSPTPASTSTAPSPSP